MTCPCAALTREQQATADHAAEIVRLRARVAELEAERDDARGDIDALIADYQAAVKDRDAALDLAEGLERDVCRLNAEGVHAGLRARAACEETERLSAELRQLRRDRGDAVPPPDLCGATRTLTPTVGDAWTVTCRKLRCHSGEHDSNPGGTSGVMWHEPPDLAGLAAREAAR